MKETTIVMVDPLPKVEQQRMQQKALTLKPPVMLRFVTPEQYKMEQAVKRRVN